MELVIASGNLHKIEEISLLLPKGVVLRSSIDLGITEEIPETAATLEGNADMKASYIYDRFKVNCFADDTGLEVEALGGAPGVHSARYATDGHDHAANVALLLHNLSGQSSRRARFRTVIALYWEGEKHLFEGVVEGVIVEQCKGEGGFGYDPIFVPDGGGGKTFAQMDLASKNLLSHRGVAVRKLISFLESNV